MDKIAYICIIAFVCLASFLMLRSQYSYEKNRRLARSRKRESAFRDAIEAASPLERMQKLREFLDGELCERDDMISFLMCLSGVDQLEEVHFLVLNRLRREYPLSNDECSDIYDAFKDTLGHEDNGILIDHLRQLERGNVKSLSY